MTDSIDWNMINLTEIYESFDISLKMLDDGFERARLDIDAAIKHGATPESMIEPIEEFAMELHAYCEYIELQNRKKENKTQKQ